MDRQLHYYAVFQAFFPILCPCFFPLSLSVAEDRLNEPPVCFAHSSERREAAAEQRGVFYLIFRMAKELFCAYLTIYFVQTWKRDRPSAGAHCMIGGCQPSLSTRAEKSLFNRAKPAKVARCSIEQACHAVDISGLADGRLRSSTLGLFPIFSSKPVYVLLPTRTYT
jgi:hypothetical protein